MPPSVALLLAAVLPVVSGIKQLAHSGTTTLAVASIACGLAAGVVFWRRQQRLNNPMVDVSLFRDRTFATTVVTLIFGLASVTGVYLFVTVYLQYVADLSAFEAGLWLLTPAAAMTMTSILAPRLARRCPASVIVGGSLALSAVGFTLLTQVDAGSGPVPLLTGITVVYLGQGPIMALGTDLVVGAAPPSQAGAASALSETSVELGLALGVALLGSLGNAVYRHHLTVPDMLPTAAAETARQSVTDAAAIAGQLPEGLADDLTQAAREAFAIGLNYVAVAAAMTVGLLTFLTIAVRRQQSKR